MYTNAMRLSSWTSPRRDCSEHKVLFLQQKVVWHFIKNNILVYIVAKICCKTIVITTKIFYIFGNFSFSWRLTKVFSYQLYLLRTESPPSGWCFLIANNGNSPSKCENSTQILLTGPRATFPDLETCKYRCITHTVLYTVHCPILYILYIVWKFYVWEYVSDKKLPLTFFLFYFLWLRPSFYIV